MFIIVNAFYIDWILADMRRNANVLRNRRVKEIINTKTGVKNKILNAQLPVPLNKQKTGAKIRAVYLTGKIKMNAPNEPACEQNENAESAVLKVNNFIVCYVLLLQHFGYFVRIPNDVKKSE